MLVFCQQRSFRRVLAICVGTALPLNSGRGLEVMTKQRQLCVGGRLRNQQFSARRCRREMKHGRLRVTMLSVRNQ